MPDELKVKAIVTKAIPYHESDMIVTLVSIEHGVLTATARGCLKPKAKLRYASEPLNFGDYVLCGKNGRYVITECSQINSFIKITADLDRYYASGLILESLQMLSSDSQPETFLSAIKALNRLASFNEDADEIITDYLLDVLKANGISYDYSHCNVCGCDIVDDAFVKEYDGVVCEHCRDDEWLQVDRISRRYILGLDRSISHHLKIKANILLIDIIYLTLGIKIGKNFFLE